MPQQAEAPPLGKRWDFTRWKLRDYSTKYSTPSTKGKGKRIIENLHQEVMEIPKVGQVWIEERNFEQRIDLEYHDFVGAFTGRAYEVLQDCEDHGRYNTYLTYHTLNGKPAIFVWAELKTESYAPNNIEVTLQIPKALLPAILGRNTQGYTVWGKVRRDMMKLYERKAATK